MAPGAPEIEWQFDALDLRPIERWLAVAGGRSAVVERDGSRLLRDTYLDTADWRLHKAGFTLRLRVTDGRREVTMKSTAPPVDGRRERLELTQPVEEGAPEAVVRSRGPVGDRIRALVGRRDLNALFEVSTTRSIFTVRAGDGDMAELALDDATIATDDGQPVRLQRVEVEVVRGTVAALEPFVKEISTQCALRPSSTSKFEAGLLARGLRPPGPPDLGPTDVHAEATTAEVAFASLRTHAATFLAHEPGARLGEDPEEVHDMRVAIRRMRAAIALFEDALPVRFRSFRRELKWVAQALGDVRDLDVQLEQLGEWARDMEQADAAALRPLVRMAERKRKRARGRLLRALDSRRYVRLVEGLVDALRRGPVRRPGPGRALITAVAPDLVRRRYRRVRRAGDRLGPESAPEEFHKLRIRCKRLRYSLEFVSNVYPDATSPMIKRSVKVQDLLGSHQDAQVALANLREIVDRQGATLPPRALFVLGRLTERFERQAADLRARFPEAYRRVRGKRWKALRREMRRRRPPAPAIPDRPVRQPTVSPLTGT